MPHASLFSPDDLHLFAEGTWLRAYEKMGAHIRTVDGVPGVNFAVWAPGAMAVAVNVFDPDGSVRRTHMRRQGTGGIWEAFMPGAGPGAFYKYHIVSRYNGYVVEKADPYAFHAEVRPHTASIVYDLGTYTWHDADWLRLREQADPFARPVAVYEVHAMSWRRGEQGRLLGYRELAEQLVTYVVQHGFTHIELMPITEHPVDDSWGYQTTGYFAPTSRYGTPHDFMAFVDICHQHNIGVILDWVPSHFAKEGHGLGFFDGTHRYEHADPRRGEHIGWGTYVFNYEQHEVLTFLLSNAHYWLREYHIDGFRIDAVASMLYHDYERPAGAWVANQYGGRENLEAAAFLRSVNDVVHTQHPGALTFAEESTTWPGVTAPTSSGGLGFDFKWNMGWMNDTLRYIKRDPLYRPHYHPEVTFSYTYAFHERYLLPLSHDEVVHLKGSLLNKAPGDRWQRFATLRALLASMYGHPGKKLLFMGGEFAQEHEWEFRGTLQWHLLDGAAGLPHRQMLEFVTLLNQEYAARPALHEGDVPHEGFAWIDGSDANHSVVAFLRRGVRTGDVLAVICNWTPVPRYDYPIGLPDAGPWEEVLNSDAVRYGGSGVGNTGVLHAHDAPLDGYPCSLRLTLPPLGVLYLHQVRGQPT